MSWWVGLTLKVDMCNQKTWIPESGFFISIRWSEQHAYPCLLQFPTNKRGLGFFIIKKLSLEPIFKPMWRCQCISIIWQRNRISWLMLTRCECYLCPALEKIKYISDNSSRSNASSPALRPLNHMSVLTSAVISAPGDAMHLLAFTSAVTRIKLSLNWPAFFNKVRSSRAKLGA